MHKIDAFDLFLFDFDGLLVDTEKMHMRAYQEVLKSHGIDMAWDMEKYCLYAHNPPYLLEKILYQEFPQLQKYSWEDIYQQKKQRYLTLIEQEPISLMNGVEQFLAILEEKKKKSCIVTNSTKRQVEVIRNKLPVLHKIRYLITREDYTHSKPDPSCYLLAQKKYADKGEQVIGFEDTLRGYTALQKAQILGVLITPYPSIYQDKVDGNVLFSSFSSFLQKIAG